MSKVDPVEIMASALWRKDNPHSAWHLATESDQAVYRNASETELEALAANGLVLVRVEPEEHEVQAAWDAYLGVVRTDYRIAVKTIWRALLTAQAKEGGDHG
ncbi:MAG: hypothetical protein AAGK02_07200 [Pseudomonadota bacterium]